MGVLRDSQMDDFNSSVLIKNIDIIYIFMYDEGGNLVMIYVYNWNSIQ